MSANSCNGIIRTADGLVFAGSVLTYRITGLLPYNLERLRVTLKAALPDNPGTFHIDTLDLYYSRARETFAETCAKYLKIQIPLVMAELSQLIGLLEAERVAMRERGNAAPVPAMTEADKTEAMELLKSKDLLTRIVSDFDALGYIGERTNKALAYLAAVSRLLPDPLALLVLSRSGAGKTSLQEAVCRLVPPESVIQYTRLTGQSLFYRDADALKHKVLAIEEDGGMQAAMYSVKTLISSQKLSVAATRTDPKTGKFSVDEYTVSGPVVVMVSTTNPTALDDETKRRFLVLTIDESEEQTRRILSAQRAKHSPRWYAATAGEPAVTRLHHNLQRLLKPVTVLIPDDLRITWPCRRLQYRGEHAKYYSLIRAIALLFQYQRKSGTVKRMDGAKVEGIYATQADVDLALELGREVFLRNVDDVSPTGRKLLTHITALAQTKYAAWKSDNPKSEVLLSELPFSRKELRETSGWSETQVRTTCDQLTELGYLGRVAGRHGSAYRYVLLDDGNDDPRMELSTESAITNNQRLSPQTSRVRSDFAAASQMA